LIFYKTILSGRADQDAPVAALGFFGHDIEMGGGSSDFASGLSNRFALLCGDQSPDIGRAFAHQVGGFVEDRCAGSDRRIAPHREGPCRCIQSAVEIGLAGFRQIGNHFSGRWIDNMMDITILNIDPLAIDMKLQCFGIYMLHSCS